MVNGPDLRLTVAALVLPVVAGAQQPDWDVLVERCATRDTATAWLETTNAWRNEQPGSWSNDSLRNALLALESADRLTQTSRMREIIQRFGWPTRTMVGARGASAAMRIAQNNPALQAESFRLMTALPADEVQQSEMAALEDRYHVSRNEPQRFATQLKPDSVGAEFYPVDTLARIGERRAAVGLPPMIVYVCMIRAATRREATLPPPEYSAAARTDKPRPYWRPVVGGRAGIPQLASATLGGMYVVSQSSNRERWSGLLFIAEPGVDAGRFHLGYGSSDGRGTGVSGTLTALNYWGDGEWEHPHRLYAGFELHVSVRHVDVGVGQYQSLRYGKLRFAASVGVGL